ncbi:MAG: signal recognition particle-docking protein FtsY [Treponema sp.]|jgi:fused signal recognition particle receptor|nr:signal recognition particle-docking protein FtsY [Treponema sp.]
MSKISFAQKVRSLFSMQRNRSEDFFDDLTDALIEGDIGAKTAVALVEELEKNCKTGHITDEHDILLKLKLLLTATLKSERPEIYPGKTNIWLLLGVNGVGKTTTAAKLAAWYKPRGVSSIVMAAADTFRAAAIDQIQIHGKNTGIRVVNHQMGSDPSAVVFDAAEAVKASGGGLVLADTAGRLHNKENLVHELEKINRTATQKADDGCSRRILVIDATTGQNALRQAEVFNEAVGVDAVILTKYDSSAKGGAAVSIGKELGIPVAFVCTGEKYGDIEEFSAEKYIDEFLGL